MIPISYNVKGERRWHHPLRAGQRHPGDLQRAEAPPAQGQQGHPGPQGVPGFTHLPGKKSGLSDSSQCLHKTPETIQWTQF